MMETDLGKAVVVVAWHNKAQHDQFCAEWQVTDRDPIIFQEDKHGEGCAVTKNKGIRKAYDKGAEIICVLDSDCYPAFGHSLSWFVQLHVEALNPQLVQRVVPTTTPHSRGTPYQHLSMKMPVAASMGFWTSVPDFDAITALHLGSNVKVEFNQRTIFGSYFPFCGMNFAFRREWIDCAMQIEGCNRWEDIFGGYIWQKVAYEKRHCFNLCGPVIRHARQSNVWANLRDEAKYIEQNETLWETIENAPRGLSAYSLRKLCINPLLSSSEGSLPSQWRMRSECLQPE